MFRLALPLMLMVLAGCAAKPEAGGATPQQPLPPATTQPQHTPSIASPAAASAADAQLAESVAPPPSVSPMAMKAMRAPAPQPSLMRMQPPATSTERYQKIEDNPVKVVAEAPVSTFSIDVDTGSYSNVRRLLQQGQLPNPDAVRVEELINYFPYDYPQPQGAVPFAVHTELAPAPWNAQRVLLRIGIKGRDVAKETLPPANLVFLVDVSGSMDEPNKLPLLKSSLKLLVNELRPRDQITLVTYAGATEVTLPPTAGSDKAKILAAIDKLGAGGSTYGAGGLQLAYQMAQQGYIKGGINRILLATDGDFNVGITDFRELKAMIEEKRKSGVSLSTLGFGAGNYNDQLMEQLADAGNGAYSYIDNLMEGHKVLVNETSSTLATIAKDVKIQIEFNPNAVKEYRLIGYENRLLNREDFNNDKVDAGDIGAGHTVTALYELTLAGSTGLVDPLRYQASSAKPATGGHELAFVKLRYKAPEADHSQLISLPVEQGSLQTMAAASNEFRFASAVAGFGQLLRGGKYTGNWSFKDARQLAQSAIGSDRFGYRGEFLRLLDLAASLSTATPTAE